MDFFFITSCQMFKPRFIYPCSSLLACVTRWRVLVFLLTQQAIILYDEYRLPVSVSRVLQSCSVHVQFAINQSRCPSLDFTQSSVREFSFPVHSPLYTNMTMTWNEAYSGGSSYHSITSSLVYATVSPGVLQYMIRLCLVTEETLTFCFIFRIPNNWDVWNTLLFHSDLDQVHRNTVRRFICRRKLVWSFETGHKTLLLNPFKIFIQNHNLFLSDAVSLVHLK
jgi:hypothetical protein